MNSYIDCPLMEEKIEDGDCYVISTYAEGVAPDCIVPKKILDVENCKQKCLECKHHRYD